MAYGIRKGDASDGFNFDTFNPSDSLGMDSLRQFMDALSGYQMDDAMADAAARDALNAAQGFAQASDANVATCEAQGKDFDPVNQICVPRDAGGASVGGAGYTLAQAIEDLAGTNLPGVLDIPGIGDAVDSGLDGIAGVIDVISEGIGLGDGWKKEAVLGGDGVSINVLDANQTSQNPGGGAVSAQSGNTTVSVDTGSPAGNIILAGGTLGEMGGLGSGEGTDTELLMRGLCAMQGKEYDENTGLCKQASSSQPPGGSTAGGTTTTGGGGADDEEDASTTVTIGGSTGTQTDPCDDPVYAADNPLECLVVGPNTGDGNTPAGGVGPVPDTKICPDGTLVGMDDDCPATQVTEGTPTKRTKQKICPDGSSVEENEDCPDTTTTTTKICDDGSVVDINEDCPEKKIVCGDGKELVNGACVDKCGPNQERINGICVDKKIVDPIPVCPEGTKLAGKPIPADENCNPVGPGTGTGTGTGTECIDCTCPEYVVANPIECGGTQPDCTDPVYAYENPVECGGGTGIDPCTELEGECAKLGQCADCATMQCEECPPTVGEGGVEGEEIIPSLCGDEVYAMLNPEICNPSPQYSMPGGGGTFVSTEPGEIADKGYYDIGMESGVFGSNDLLSEVETILRGR